MVRERADLGAGFILFNPLVESSIPVGDELDNMNDDSIDKLGEGRHNVVCAVVARVSVREFDVSWLAFGKWHWDEDL